MAVAIEGTPATTSDQTAGTTTAINLPASIQAGEKLVICVAAKCNTNEVAISGWARIVDGALTSGSTISVHVFWVTATGSEGATVNMTSSTSTRVAAVAYRVSGAGTPTGVNATGQANSTAPNPPNHTFTSSDGLALAIAASSHGRIPSAGAGNAGYPTNYSNGTLSGPDNGTATNAGIGVGRRALTAASSEDPGAFTTTGSGVEEVIAATVFIPVGVTTVTSGALDITGAGSITLASSLYTAFSGGLDLTGAGSITLASSLYTAFSGALDLTGAGSITVSGAVFKFSGALDLTGASALDIASSFVTALSGALDLTGNGTVTVADSDYTAFSGALDVTGAGLITISNPFVTRFSGALDLTGAGSIVLASSLYTAFSGGLDLTGAGTITIVSSDVSGDTPIDSGALDLTGAGTITISNPLITVLSGALDLTGAGSIAIADSDVTALSGPLSLLGNGVVNVSGSLYTAFSGPLDLTGDGRITIFIPLTTIPFGATVNPLMGIIDDGKGVPMSVNAEKYRVHTSATGAARKRVVLPGSWILGIMVEYVTSESGTDLTIGDAVRTILNIQNSNTDTYFPVREEVVSSDGTPLGVYEPPIITDEFFIEVANGGAGKDIEVTVFYQ